jgi:hypothetical protein
MPIMQRIELVIKLKTGLDAPPMLLERDDEIIEMRWRKIIPV